MSSKKPIIAHPEMLKIMQVDTAVADKLHSFSEGDISRKGLNLEKIRIPNLPDIYYTIRLNNEDRILLSKSNGFWFALDVLYGHAYQHISSHRNSWLIRRIEEAKASQQLLFQEADDEIAEIGKLHPENLSSYIAYQGTKHYLLTPIQRTMFHAPLPCIGIGAAGSGKTSTAISRLAETICNTREGHFLYLAELEALHEEVKKCLAAELEDRGYPEGIKLVQFLTAERAYNEKYGKPKCFSNRLSFQIWLKENPTDQQGLDADTIYTEFLSFCGYNHYEDYIHEEAERNIPIKQDQSKALWVLYQNYLNHLKATNSPDLALMDLALNDHSYTMIVIDEGYDLSRRQHNSALTKAIDCALFICLGGHQQTQSARPLIAYLKRQMHKLGFKNLDSHVITLGINHRSAQNITLAANGLAQLKNLLIGTLALNRDEPRYLTIAPNAPNGSVQWLSDLNSFSQLEEYKSSVHFVVLCPAHFKKEAVALYGQQRVFTPLEFKGLEAGYILCHRLFEDPRLEKIFKKMPLILELMSDAEQFSLPKKGLLPPEVLLPLNELIIAFSRAEIELRVLETSTLYYLQPIYSLFQTFFNKIMDSSPKLTIKTPETSTVDDWAKHQTRLEKLGLSEQANAISPKTENSTQIIRFVRKNKKQPVASSSGVSQASLQNHEALYNHLLKIELTESHLIGTNSKQLKGTNSKQLKGTNSKQLKGTNSKQLKGTNSKQLKGTNSKQLKGTNSKQDWVFNPSFLEWQIETKNVELIIKALNFAIDSLTNIYEAFKLTKEQMTELSEITKIKEGRKVLGLWLISEFNYAYKKSTTLPHKFEYYMQLISTYKADLDVNMERLSILTLALIYKKSPKNFLSLIIKENPKLVNQFNNGQSPLHTAAEFGNLEACKLLCEAGADVNAKTDTGGSALNYAIHQSQEKIIEYLTPMTDLTLVDDKGFHPLHYLLLMPSIHLPSLRMMLTNSIEQGVNLALRNEFGTSIISQFLLSDLTRDRNTFLDIIQLLLKNKFDFNVKIFFNPFAFNNLKKNFLSLAKIYETKEKNLVIISFKEIIKAILPPKDIEALGFSENSTPIAAPSISLQTFYNHFQQGELTEANVNSIFKEPLYSWLLHENKHDLIAKASEAAIHFEMPFIASTFFKADETIHNILAATAEGNKVRGLWFFAFMRCKLSEIKLKKTRLVYFPGFILQFTVDFCVQNREGNSLLHVFLFDFAYISPEYISEIIQKSPRLLTLKNKDQLLPVHIAAEQQNVPISILKMLLEKSIEQQIHLDDIISENRSLVSLLLVRLSKMPDDKALIEVTRLAIQHSSALDEPKLAWGTFKDDQDLCSVRQYAEAILSKELFLLLFSPKAELSTVAQTLFSPKSSKNNGSIERSPQSQL